MSLPLFIIGFMTNPQQNFTRPAPLSEPPPTPTRTPSQPPTYSPSTANYIFDTNVILKAQITCYHPTICPGFWEFMTLRHWAGLLFSLDVVHDELLANPGEYDQEHLRVWLAQNSSAAQFFLRAKDDAVKKEFERMQEIIEANSNYNQKQVEKFINGADLWLIAYAKVHGCVVVTEEQPADDAYSRVRIPDICRQFGVPCRNTFGMLEELGIAFVLN